MQPISEERVLERATKASRVVQIIDNIGKDNEVKAKKEERRLQERTGDAWASGGEEGRGKLRKGAGIRKQEMIRACPNGETRRAECPPPDACPGRTQGTETSKYLQEEKGRKKHRFPQ